MGVGLALVIVGLVVVIVSGVVVKRAITGDEAADIRQGSTSGIPQRVRRASLAMLIGFVLIIAGIVVAIVG